VFKCFILRDRKHCNGRPIVYRPIVRFWHQFVAVFGNKVAVFGNKLLPETVTLLPFLATIWQTDGRIYYS